MSDEKLRHIAFWTFWGGAAVAATGLLLENPYVATTGGALSLGGIIAAFAHNQRNPYSTSPITGV